MKIAFVQQAAEHDHKEERAARARGARGGGARGRRARRFTPSSRSSASIRSDPAAAGRGAARRAGSRADDRGVCQRRRASSASWSCSTSTSGTAPSVRLLAGDRRGRHAARPDAHDPHHRLRLLPRAGLLHAGRHRRAGLRHEGRTRSAWPSATTVTIPNTCARWRSAAPISSSCRRPARSASGRRASTRPRCRSRRFRTATSSALCNRVGEEECLTFAGESFVCATRRPACIARAARLRGDDPATPTSTSRRRPAIARAPAVPAASPAGAVCRLAASRWRERNDSAAMGAVLLRPIVALSSSSIAGACSAKGRRHRRPTPTMAEAHGSRAHRRRLMCRAGIPEGAYDIRAAQRSVAPADWGLFNFQPADAEALRAMLQPGDESVARRRGVRYPRAGSSGGPHPARARSMPNRQGRRAHGPTASREGGLVVAVNWKQGRALLLEVPVREWLRPGWERCEVVPRTGIEPVTPAFSVLCSTD